MVTRTLPLGSVGYENAVNESGERLIWLEPRDRLRALRGAGEDYSQVILRLASATVAAQTERPPRGGLSDVE